MDIENSKTDYSVPLAERDSKPSRADQPDRDPMIDADDLLVLADYAICFPAAWALPEAWWPPVANALALALTPTRFRDRRTTREAIRAILGERSTAGPVEALPRRQHAMALLEAMQHLRSHRPGGWTPRIELAGAEHIDAARAAGKGAVLWITDFIFSTLVTKIALRRAGYEITHLSRPGHPLSSTRFGRTVLNSIVTRLETRQLAKRVVVDEGQLTGGMRTLLRTLKANGVISITVGNESRQTVQIPLLGGYIHLAKGAPRLAAASGAPLLPVFTQRGSDGGFTTTVEAPIAFTRDGTPEEIAADAMRRYVERLEPRLIATPQLWYDWTELITVRPTL